MSNTVADRLARIQSSLGELATLNREIASSLDTSDYDRVQAKMAHRRRLLESFDSQLREVGESWLASGAAPTPEERESGRRIIEGLHRFERGASAIEDALMRARSRSHERLRSVKMRRTLMEHQSSPVRGQKGGWCDVSR